MLRRGGSVTLLTLLLGFAAAPAAAQLVREVEAHADNDNFNFWLHRDDRPDYEYTHGAWISVTSASARGWGPRLAPGLQACGAGRPAERCLLTSWEFGQEIYTPRTNAAELVPDERPHAGWLYGAASAIWHRPVDRHTLRLEVGVTGPPSLAGPMQRAVHAIAGFWEPLGWRHQLPFEPGVVLGYRYDRQLAVVRAGDASIARIRADAGAAGGTVWTGARGGLEARIGWRVPGPWAAGAGGEEGFAVFGFAGVEGDAVLRNMFLDGTLLRESHRVEKHRWVGRHFYGGAARLGRWELGFRITSRGREYRTEPGGHTYSSFTARLLR